MSERHGVAYEEPVRAYLKRDGWDRCAIVWPACTSIPYHTVVCAQSDHKDDERCHRCDLRGLIRWLLYNNNINYSHINTFMRAVAYEAHGRGAKRERE